MTEFQRPRGTRDFGPEEMARRRYVEGRMRATAELFGFGEVMTPTFESAELFIERSGEGIIEEMYAFKDKGGRDIALRPELTAPVMRFYVNEMQSRPKPVKVFYFGNMFRYERPQSGRYREFFQFGAELIGAPSMESDAEVIALALWCLDSAGLKDVVVRVGNLSILKGLLTGIGVPEEKQAACRRLIDKADFAGLEELLICMGIGESGLSRLLGVISLKGGRDSIAKARSLWGADIDGFGYLDGLLERLSSYGFERCMVDFGVARGLDYYSGMVFEIDAPCLGAEKQVCGGGAYSLAELFGGDPVNSTGFAFGFDRVLLALENSGIDVPARGLRAYIVPVGEGARGAALGALVSLRKAGISADMDLMGRSISKALAYANSLGAAKVVIIGGKELADCSATLRDMKTGEQSKVPLGAISRYL
jgi:histidyl-tRNA synthetase